jgi:hypothetical protein
LGREFWFSPSRLATIIASLVRVAKFASGGKCAPAAGFLFDYADWLSVKLEEWMALRDTAFALRPPAIFSSLSGW